MKPVIVTSEDNRVRVELDDIGEGLSGDYNPGDPNDVSLARFTILRYAKDSHESAEDEGWEWEPVDGVSFCTQIPTSTKPRELQRLAGLILQSVYWDVKSGTSIKRKAGLLSWLPKQPGKLA